MWQGIQSCTPLGLSAGRIWRFLGVPEEVALKIGDTRSQSLHLGAFV